LQRETLDNNIPVVELTTVNTPKLPTIFLSYMLGVTSMNVENFDSLRKVSPFCFENYYFLVDTTILNMELKLIDELLVVFIS